MSWLLIALLACGEVDDLDQDGWVASEDCDDTDPEVNPEALEICDGIDNDCDLLVDESGGSLHPDADGDGYGDPSITLDACIRSPGIVDDDTDCDDADPEIHPAATEICANEVDENCDDIAHPGDPWWPDLDGDGIGDATQTPTLSCIAIEGRSDIEGDCNDADDTVYQGAPERCDGIDNNCDDAVPDDERDDDGDGFLVCELDCDDTDPTSNPVADELCDGLDNDCDGDIPANEVDADTDGVLACLDCDDTDATRYPGASELCDGIDNDCDGDVPADEVDIDGDLYLACEDCDDTAPSVNPLADELCDGVDNNCDGTLDDVCVVEDHCGTITADETWGYGEHTVSCDVFVGDATNAPTLTIAEGAIVRFAPGFGLRIGQSAAGRLLVEDTGPDAGTLFTSDSAAPVPGDWLGLRFGQHDSGSSLVDATIEYAGSGGTSAGGGIDITDASVSLLRVESRHNARDGVRVAASADILESTFSDNGATGVWLDSADDVTALDGNTFDGNATYSLLVDLHHVPQLGANTYGTAGRIGVAGGQIEQSASWPAAGVPYVLLSPVAVGGSNAPVLDLASNAELEFSAGAGLSIGHNGVGGLTTTDPVLLRGRGTAGDWTGLRIRPDASVVTLDGLTIRDAGSPVHPCIDVESAEVSISASDLRNCGREALAVHTGSTLGLVGTTLADSPVGLRLSPDSTIDPVVGMSTNRFVATDEPLVLGVDDLIDLDPSQVFLNNTTDAVSVEGAGAAVRDGTWADLGVPYVFEQSVDVQASITIASGSTLLFATGQNLVVGGSAPGGLVASGVTFSSAAATPAAGDWGGIQFQTNCTASQLTTSTVGFAGLQPTRFGAVEFQGCDLGTIATTTVHDSALHGVFVSLGTTAVVDDATITCTGVLGDCIHRD